tara:strand:+ start:26688 stop:27959 length:1272 start_codon:yes stop_codon:yes gene_type:complete
MITLSTQGFSQCDAPSTVFASNVNYYNAEVNWNTTSGTYFYRIRFKVIGSSSWSYKNNIDSTLNEILLIDLLPLSDYVWQIKSYCDTTNTNTSSWSVTDTFTTNTNSCPNTNNLFTTNINFNNAVANWDTVSGANRYKLRYKTLGTSLWSFLGPIYQPLDSITIPLLQQSTSYEWQVLTFHDSTNLLGSLWSESDTFTTPSFVYTAFNPQVMNTLSSLECNVSSDFSLMVTQTAYEPDIGTSTITSDGGYFDISSISMGDSVGYAIMSTTSQNITAVLRAGIIAGQNYAIINSYDSAGSLIGFFTIQNDNGGIKVTTTTPNDNNDYTSGYISEVLLANLFINPSNAGPLHFFVDIESELNDQIYDTDTVQIWCNTNSIIEQKEQKEIIETYDMLGKKVKIREKNKPFFYMYNDGTIQKKIVFE